MNQLSLFTDSSSPESIALPALRIGPLSVACGKMLHAIRPGCPVGVLSTASRQISQRVQEEVLQVSNGEHLIITQRNKLDRPSDVDGILHRGPNGSLKWLSHKLIDEVLTIAASDGWGKVAQECAASWKDQFHFKAETPNGDGSVTTGNEGLRPPQIGALHAIGAHWSLSQHPATIVMPTGTGKTETMLAALAAYIRKPLLVIVPWDLLRLQTFNKFVFFGLLRQLGVLSSECRNPVVGLLTKRPSSEDDLKIFDSCNVVVSTMSSLGGDRVEDLMPEIASRVGVLILDEAHHAPAGSWTKIRDAFRGRPILQFTATPFRRDKKLVDGTVIYNYPLRTALQDGYFKRISFEPVYSLDLQEADNRIAAKAVEQLRSDISAGFSHVLMARCENINRANEVFEIYKRIANDFNPIVVHSEISDTDARISALRSGANRIVVCVNMLGEGFDLPELKIAAVHDMHRSLAILLQFTGRFTRSSGHNIGEATVVGNIADSNVSYALERLYSEDADWNELLSEMSSDAIREHAELVDFLKSSRRLDDADEEREAISHKLLTPPLSTLIYQANSFNPRRFHEGLQNVEVHRVWLHETSNTLFFVTRSETHLRWTRSKEIRDQAWNLFILHYDSARHLLFLSSTDHSSTFDKLAKATGASQIISGERIFHALGRITRLTFQNIGVKKHGRKNLSFAMYTGAQVEEALSITERTGSIKNNLSGTGWEGGRPVTIGCSLKGRVWSREVGSITDFIRWCENVGDKIQDDGIDNSKVLSNILIPKEATTLPDKQVLGIDWPHEILSHSEERVCIARRDDSPQWIPTFLFELCYVASDATRSELSFCLKSEGDEIWATYVLTLGGDAGYTIRQIDGSNILIKIGAKEWELVDYLHDYPPLVRFVDLSELDGNLLIDPYVPQALTISEERFDAWDWEGVDISKESIWKDGNERRDSIQWNVAQKYIASGFDVVFDDDSAGEAADLVCLKEETDHIKLALIHCKFSGGDTAGERVKDVVEVCSQAVRSAKWKWKFKDLCRHVTGRETRLSSSQRSTRFLAGRAADMGRISKVSRFKEIRPEVLIVQPGLSKSNRTSEQDTILAGAMAYLKETIGVDLDVICSP